MEDPRRWIDHTPMSDPREHAVATRALPATISGLNEIIQGLLIHGDWLDAYGVDQSKFDQISRTTLPVAKRLGLILKRDDRPLATRRSLAGRSVATCRDFALMLCSILRSRGVPARVRCGFAEYFGDGWEDHWVCEYWLPDIASWRLSDPQIDAALKEKLALAFDPSDVPSQSFVTAGRAWLGCRSGALDPESFGHGATKGLWFVMVNVIRDHYAMNGRETSAWDDWRAAPAAKSLVPRNALDSLDALAGRPEQPLVEVGLFWLT